MCCCVLCGIYCQNVWNIISICPLNQVNSLFGVVLSLHPCEFYHIGFLMAFLIYFNIYLLIHCKTPILIQMDNSSTYFCLVDLHLLIHSA